MLDRSILVIIFFSFLSTSAWGQKSDREIALAARPFIDAWQRCVLANAQRFANSKEPAEFIVKVAMQSCQEDRIKLNLKMIGDGLPRWLATSALGNLDRQTEQMAAIAILEHRAR